MGRTVTKGKRRPDGTIFCFEQTCGFSKFNWIANENLCYFPFLSFRTNEAEDAQIESGGMHGQRLAEFVGGELRKRGFKASQPLEEDWGWLVEIENRQFRLWIGCGSYENRDGLLCFIEPHQPVVRKVLWFRKIDTTAIVGKLQQSLNDILSNEPSVSNVGWWTHDEFNHPKSIKKS